MTPQDDFEYPPQKATPWRTLLIAAASLLPPTLVIAALVLYRSEEPAPVVDPAPVAEAIPAGPPAPDPVALLQATRDRVVVLEAELDAKLAELTELQAGTEKSRKAGATKIARLESQITQLKSDVRVATTERDDLRGRLGTALADLEKETALGVAAKERATVAEGANTENLWVAFTQQARLEMCQQVTRRGRDACGEKLAAWFDAPKHDRFAACVADSRTLPMLWRMGDEAEQPSNAELVDVSLFGHKKDWYVLYCDPTLPEAQVAAAELPPPVFVPSPWRSR